MTCLPHLAATFLFLRHGSHAALYEYMNRLPLPRVCSGACAEGGIATRVSQAMKHLSGTEDARVPATSAPAQPLIGAPRPQALNLLASSAPPPEVTASSAVFGADGVGLLMRSAQLDVFMRLRLPGPPNLTVGARPIEPSMGLPWPASAAKDACLPHVVDVGLSSCRSLRVAVRCRGGWEDQRVGTLTRKGARERGA